MSRTVLSSAVTFIASNSPIVVFSDIDGVLSGLHTPSLAAAASALEHLPAEEAALVLCSSKTRAELELIRQKLGLADPFICENGAAVFVPRGYFDFDIPNARDIGGYRVIEFGGPHGRIAEALRRTAERLGIQIVGFDDLSIQEVARECNLPLLRARLAKLREYEEPFRIIDADPSAAPRLFKALHTARLRCVKGLGQYHYVGAPVDSSIGVSLLTAFYRRAHEGSVVTVGITDPLRDENLMPLVDHAVMIQDDDATAGLIDIADWAEGILDTVRERRRILKSNRPITAEAEHS